MMTALDAGAEDFSEEEDSYEVLTDPDSFEEVREALEKAGIPMLSAEVTMIPQNYVELTDERIYRELWICWMMMMMYRLYIITGTSKKIPRT